MGIRSPQMFGSICHHLTPNLARRFDLHHKGYRSFCHSGGPGPRESREARRRLPGRTTRRRASSLTPRQAPDLMAHVREYVEVLGDRLAVCTSAGKRSMGVRISADGLIMATAVSRSRPRAPHLIPSASRNGPGRPRTHAGHRSISRDLNIFGSIPFDRHRPAACSGGLTGRPAKAIAQAAGRVGSAGGAGRDDRKGVPEGRSGSRSG